jgi:hypothetical protein
MDMIVKLLVPGVEDLDDTGNGAEELPVCGKLKDGLRRALMEERVKELLIAEHQRIELMRKGKNQMEVGGTDDFRAAFIGPDLV